MFAVVVGDLFVDLIRQHQDFLLERDIGEGLELFSRVDRAGGVAW